MSCDKLITPYYVRDEQCCSCTNKPEKDEDGRFMGRILLYVPYLDERPQRYLCANCPKNKKRMSLIYHIDGITYGHLPVIIPKKWRESNNLKFSYTKDRNPLKYETLTGTTKAYYNDDRKISWLVIRNDSIGLRCNVEDGYTDIDLFELQTKNSDTLGAFSFTFTDNKIDVEDVLKHLQPNEREHFRIDLLPLYVKTMDDNNNIKKEKRKRKSTIHDNLINMSRKQMITRSLKKINQQHDKLISK